MDDEYQISKCQLCGRTRRLTFHHLIPKMCHSNRWFKKNFTREEMSRGIHICRACHSYLHKKFSQKELGRSLNTIETLLANDRVQSYLAWAKKRG